MGLGSQIFGEKTDVFASSTSDNESASDGDDDDDGALITAMASVTIENSEWACAPSYPAIYLSTVTEYLPPSKSLPSAKIQDPEEGKDTSLASESYENSLNVDRVFETFSRRVGYQGEQCVRYVTELFFEFI
jgi:pre-rRNA-processing protein TSR4